MSPDNQHIVILDTDPGIDDAMTFAFLRSRPDVVVKAITTVFGNADIATTTRNALYLADRFGMDAPVFRGAEHPLTIPRRPVASHVHGHDALGDIGVSEHHVGEPAASCAHEQIVRMLRDNPGRVSILAIGPLTNLALALQADPGIAALARDVVVMGGAFGHGTRRGNVSPVAEANIANDPHAADVVLGASWPVTMVGLDVTAACILPSVRAKRIAASGDTGQFLWDISRAYEQLYRQHDGLDGCCIHDVAAAAYLVSPGLFETSSGPIRVVTEGIAAGQTIQKPDRQSFPPGAWDDAPSQTVAVGIDVAGFLDLYEQAVSTASSPPRTVAIPSLR
ncbi:nucleoside hydrolase [Sphingobium sp. CR2-8]|uniref:nucleoside hydrolase n=1 Tax=Sphingobium sp. CR2-8 TaxID=1306534 RepID=UPI002DB99907|nr:nucleoside hydrolase [Sphingobium sp. CR2-8]MEC3909799.1 nucleoside hydrolase [Sphingobium sp. CR2-8]